ncbi:MAG: hypothetical protein R8G34_00670 [Paracoccaceae bacterium]|nr:hypothetical protein [Paracoccaceae bacterium]
MIEAKLHHVEFAFSEANLGVDLNFLGRFQKALLRNPVPAVEVNEISLRIHLRRPMKGLRHNA